MTRQGRARARAVEVVRAHGHPNVRATHPTTLEITREEHLTPRGDCIVAVGADKGARDLSEAFKRAAREPGARITITIEVPARGLRAVIRARGHPGLTFEHPTDLVVRKSDFVCGRTVAIRADKAARDLPEELVEALRDPGVEVLVRLEVF